MCSDSAIARDVARRQEAMFAMFVGPGRYTTRAALSRASGAPESTLREWAGGAAMPLHGALTLSRFLPAEALNMVTESAGKRLVDATAEESNWDRLASDAAMLVSEVCAARADGVIDHVESATLAKRTRELVGKMQHMGSGE